jgi:hypothetical protein
MNLNKFFRLSFLVSFTTLSTLTILEAKPAKCPYAAHSFHDVFKALPLNYLYQLYDSHPEAHEVLDGYFRIKKKIGHQKAKKLLTYSLFWKPQDVVNIHTIHEKRMMKGKETSFYELYVSPLKKNISHFKKAEPKTRIRIYLSSDLEFLAHELASSNVEIFVMESNSVGHSPGAMWRFLAFSDPDTNWVCCQDSDQTEREKNISIINKWLNDKSTHGFYRIHTTKYYKDFNRPYSPIIANCFGAKKGHGIDFEKAMKGFLLHRELYLDEPRHPLDHAVSGHPYGFGNHFPIYGLDERFLKHVVYFYLADRGLLSTLVSSKAKLDILKELSKGDKSYLMAKDYDYVLKRNKDTFYR